MKTKLWWAVPVAAMAAAVLWGAQASVKGLFTAGSVMLTTNPAGPPIG